MSDWFLILITLLKWIISIGIGFAAGTISARAIRSMSLEAERRRWEKERMQTGRIQRSKLELERRRLLRTDPTLKLDTAEEILAALQARSQERRQVFWEYFIPEDISRRLRRRARFTGITTGIVITWLILYLLTRAGL